MKVVDNKIVEATENELFDLYLKREMDDIMSFSDYKRHMMNSGCRIVTTKVDYTELPKDELSITMTKSNSDPDFATALREYAQAIRDEFNIHGMRFLASDIHMVVDRLLEERINKLK